MSRQDIPDGYAVIQLERKAWYPVQVERICSSMHPEGFLVLNVFGIGENETHFSHQKEAVAFCQDHAAMLERHERYRFEEQAAQGDVYPERCSHYQDIIKEVTGYTALVHRFSDEVWVYLPEYYCASCGRYHGPVTKEALVIEDALEACAEQVYTAQQHCLHQSMSSDIAIVSPL